MRKEAFEGNILRLLRNEIQYELQSASTFKSATKFGSFVVDGRAGERWITLKKRHADEDIKLEGTMFDGAVPAPTPTKDGGVINSDEMQMHITVIVTISKGEGDGVLQITCSAWPDCVEIKRLFIRANENIIAEPYSGPQFTELDDELQESLYDYLEERGINDELAAFLHQYMKQKDKTEYVRWMERVKAFIERK
ncbi:Mitochondrial glycoprotein [Vigna unguiculata]|uniref:Mitochondrial glycoprotein n=2 Tax=Vigna unguiculata TaxID=3917 RepID=A0A4D6MN05_VIGUN|nr:Mitochondrial glycoprotein [Vigna unguiculata]